MAETHSIHVKVDSTEANKAATNLNNMEKATNGAEKALSSLTRAAVGLVALDKIGGLAKGIIETNMAMESLRAQLVSVTGSAIGAQKAFKFIQDFATSTPYEIDGLTKSYIALQNYGIKPTKQVMEAVTNQASKLGASQETLDGIVRALGQAYAKGKLQAQEMLQLAERGVPVYDLLSQVTGKNAAQLEEMASKGQITRDVLEQLISKMGELSSGANANAMETLSGKISNLSDAWHQFEDALLNDKSEGLFKSIVDGITAQINKLTASLKMTPVQELEKQIGILSQNKGYDVPIAELQKKLDAARQVEAEQAKITSEQMKQEDIRVAKAEEARKKLLEGGDQITTSKKQQTAATKALNDAEATFNATIQANISAAQNQSDIQEAQIKTAEKRLQAELDAAKVQAQAAMDATNSDEEKLKIQEDLAAKSEAIIVKETELRQQQITLDEQVLTAKIAGVEQEIAAAGRFNLTQSERIRLETELQALQAQQQIIPESRAQVEVQAMQDLQAAYGDLNELKLKSVDTEKAVRDEALRTLEVMSSNLENAKSMAEGLAEAFGVVGESIGEMVVAMANYEKQMATIEIQKNEQLQKAKGDPKKRQQAEEDAAQKVAKTQVKAYGDMAQAAQGFFKKGTTGYNALGAAVKVFRAFEMAQSAMSMAKEIANISLKIGSYIAGLTTATAANVASVGPNVAADGAKSGASAIEAIAKAAAAPFPVGFVTGAAMLAFMVGIGAMASGAGGGGAPSVPATPPQPGTGTVFGDPSAVSDSLANSISRLEENSSNDLSYSSKMLTALYEIRDALKGVENTVAATITPTVETLKQMFPEGVTQAFMRFDPISLERLRKTEKIQGTGYARIDTVSESGIKRGKDLSAELPTKLEDAVGEAMLLVIDKSFNEIGKSIGVSAEKVQENLKGFMIKLGDISALGTAEETAKFIESAMNANADRAAELAFPELKRFRQTGEGFSETVVRVGDGINRAKGSLALLGMQAVSYAELSDKTAKEQADVASAIAKKTIISQSNLSEGAKQYVEELTGGLDEVISGYLQLKEINDLMRSTGIDTNNFSRTMAEAAGGLDKLTEALQSYQDNFFTDSEKLTSQTSKMRDEFSKFGFVMPKTRDEFRKMVESLNVDPVQQARLLTLADGFNEMVTAADDLNASFTDLFDNITDFQDSINSQIASLTSVTATAELSATNLQKAYRNLFESIGYLEQNITGSQSEIDLLSAVKSAIMDRYNSEMARLREVAQAQGEVLKAGLQQQIDAINASVTAQVDAINLSTTAQVDAINAATEAEVDAINSRLDAEIEARQAAHEEALKGLQDELEAANKLKSAIQQVRDYAKSLSLSPSAPLSPEARLAESQRQYQDLLRRAQGGDAEAISQLSGASQSYLDAAKQYFGSGTQYSNIFDGVRQAMEQIGAMSAPDPDSIQSHIDDLRKSQSDELAQLREAAQSQIKATQEAAKDQIKSLQDSAKDQIKAIQDAAKDQIKAMQDGVNQSIKDLTDIDKNPAMKALRDDTINELQYLAEISEKVRIEADKQAEDAKRILEDQRQYQKDQAEFMERVANVIAPTSGTSKQDETMNNMLVEQRALVTAQTAANPQIIQNLANVDARLAKIERNLRLNA